MRLGLLLAQKVMSPHQYILTLFFLLLFLFFLGDLFLVAHDLQVSLVRVDHLDIFGLRGGLLVH